MTFGKAGLSLSTLEVLQLVESDLHKVDLEIRRESFASVDAITNISNYLNNSGGKRLRPMLLLLACRLFREPAESAFRLAAVVEMIHTATLVHDDVIDIAETRRGRPAPNVVWGNHTSVLAGDWLYMQAFQMALRERNFKVLDILIALTQMMIEGELLQLERLGKLDVSEADCMELVDRKTASLFSACARLGAISGGADEAAESRLADYAWNVGIAFQLIDDILDFTAHETVLGKPVGNDLQEGKVTLPLIYALENATAGEREQVQTVLRDGNYSQVPFGSILDLIERRQGIERARERAQSFTDKARSLISEFPDSPHQRALLTVTELITERDH
jgi:octaprenyl-diphosphate synthase